MRYAIDRNRYHQFEIFQVNKLPARSYFIPFSEKEQAMAAEIGNKRYTSSKVTCLNGQWDFKFYPQPKELPQNFDTDAVEFDRIDVPSCW